MIASNLYIPEEKLTAFCQHYGVRELALFGPAVTGHFSKQSDLDFLVEFSKPNLLSAEKVLF